MKKRISALTLAVLILVACIPVHVDAFEFKDFPDVSEADWYYNSVGWLSALEIVNGDTDGYFHPDRAIKRSEFIKMLAVATELRHSPTPLRNIHWVEPYWLMAVEDGLLDFNGNNLVELSSSELEKEISRYEMAVMVTNAMTGVLLEDKVSVTNPSKAITDYSNIPAGMKEYVEQAYGKGVLTGFEDGSFQGSQSLTRAQAATVIYRLLWNNDRIMPDFDYEIIETPDPVVPDVLPVGEAFALYVRETGLINQYGRPTPAFNELVFGNANKSYFTSAADAAGYIVDLEIDIWKINSSGQKYATKAWIQVHRLLENDARAIMAEIFNSPEQFPINAIGGARYTDTLRHSWGAAIDINPMENAYGYYSNGNFIVSVGSGWWPGTNQYSITANGSVVTAFNRYGWGWGGQGWSNGWYDYMHFSILESGG